MKRFMTIYQRYHIYSFSMRCGSMHSTLGNSNIWTSLEKVIETFLSGKWVDTGDKWPVDESRIVCRDDSSGVNVIEMGLAFFFFLASSILLIVSSYKLSVACRWFLRKVTVCLSRRIKIIRKFQHISKENLGISKHIQGPSFPHKHVCSNSQFR